MVGCTLGIILLSLSALLVLGNDPDVTDEQNIELGETSNPDDLFEKSVMNRLRPELRERMRAFFRQEPGEVSDDDMRKLFESVFNHEERQEVENIFSVVVQEQMESIMGNMGGMDQLSENMAGFGGDHGHIHDHYNSDDGQDEDEQYEDGEDASNEDFKYDSEEDKPSAWGSNKKFVLEPADTSEDDFREKGTEADDQEDVIINQTPVKDEF